jgi:ADP-ribosylglycohydrolase
MRGAFIGDGVGSLYEFHNEWLKEGFDLYDPRFHFTDDSVMTLAVMDILKRGIHADKYAVVDCFRKWGRRYPLAGYGFRFKEWLIDDYFYVNDSYGNGAAMRVSPVGFFAESEEEVKTLSHDVTFVSHNHPEGLKGAEVTAMAVYLGRQGKSKDEIRAYAASNYPLFSSLNELRSSNHGHGSEICQISLPQALSAFFLTDSFDSCLREIIMAGGDCDTNAAIACPIAEAFYGAADPKLEAMVVEGFKDDPEALELLTSKESLRLFHQK